MEYLSRYRPRVFVSVFGESHLAGHYVWRFTDDRHPAHCTHAEANTALLDVYAAVDRAVGDVFNTYGRHANCLVFSGHGMTADYNPHAIVDALLRRMGLTVRGREARTSGATARSVGSAFVRAAAETTPEPIRRCASRYVLPRRAREHPWYCSRP